VTNHPATEASDHARLVIAVDGPAGSGKSTAARGAARALGFRYLDTGSTYRALTWWLLANGADISDPDVVAACARRPVIEVGTDPEAPAIRVDGTDVAGPIRTREVSNAVSAVASVPEVRRHLVAMQQGIIADAIAAGAGIVAEGRDIGTAVAPDAPVKVFLTASETVRARRRTAELATDPTATVEQTRAEQARRDRSDAPQMAKAADAVEIDTTALGLDEVIREIVALAQAAPQAHQGSAGSRGRPLQTPPDGAGSGGRPPQTPPDSAAPGQNPPLRKAGAWST
jgi:CMP/dCMP kinase